MDTEVDGETILRSGDTSATATVALPTTLASDDQRYTPDGELGRGGMGVVTAQLDHRIGRRIACKELRADSARDAGMRARFLREACIQGQLEHPAIVPVYDLGERADGTTYFTMKTIAGATLADILDRLARGDVEAQRKYPRHALLSAFSRICLAVDYAHQRRVLHRDLKPANLILGEYGEVYVLDWGLAKLLDAPVEVRDELTDKHRRAPAATSSQDMTAADAMLGTPGYMAPEQAVDASSVGPAADVYALGAILFELLALEPLHPRGLEAIVTAGGGVEARVSVRAPGRGVSAELERAIVTATAVFPGPSGPTGTMRGTARDLSVAIERYLEGEQTDQLRRASADAHMRASERSLTMTRPPTAASDPALAATAAAGRATPAMAHREAIQHAVKAIAIDPRHATAYLTLANLLRSVPASPPPPDLVAASDARRVRDLHMVARASRNSYVATFSFLAMFVWMGVREPATIALTFVPFALAAVVSALALRRERPAEWMIVAAMVASTLGFAICTRALSPLLIIPGGIATNTIGYALFVDRRVRALITAVALTAYIVPLALELGHVTSPTFTFAGALTIAPAALALPELPTLVLIIAASLSSIVTASLVVGHFRDRLNAAEHDLQTRNWLLDSLVPAELRRSAE